MSVGYHVFGKQRHAADGMAIVMHQDERGAEAIGGGGGNLGVYGNHGDPDQAIAPALVIEFDTCKFSKDILGFRLGIVRC